MTDFGTMSVTRSLSISTRSSPSSSHITYFHNPYSRDYEQTGQSQHQPYFFGKTNSRNNSPNLLSDTIGIIDSNNRSDNIDISYISSNNNNNNNNNNKHFQQQKQQQLKRRAEWITLSKPFLMKLVEKLCQLSFENDQQNEKFQYNNNNNINNNNSNISNNNNNNISNNLNKTINNENRKNVKNIERSNAVIETKVSLKNNVAIKNNNNNNNILKNKCNVTKKKNNNDDFDDSDDDDFVEHPSRITLNSTSNDSYPQLQSQRQRMARSRTKTATSRPFSASALSSLSTASPATTTTTTTSSTRSSAAAATKFARPFESSEERTTSEHSDYMKTDSEPENKLKSEDYSPNMRHVEQQLQQVENSHMSVVNNDDSDTEQIDVEDVDENAPISFRDILKNESQQNAKNNNMIFTDNNFYGNEACREVGVVISADGNNICNDGEDGEEEKEDSKELVKEEIENMMKKCDQNKNVENISYNFFGNKDAENKHISFNNHRNNIFDPIWSLAFKSQLDRKWFEKTEAINLFPLYRWQSTCFAAPPSLHTPTGSKQLWAAFNKSLVYKMFDDVLQGDRDNWMKTSPSLLQNAPPVLKSCYMLNVSNINNVDNTDNSDKHNDQLIHKCLNNIHNNNKVSNNDKSCTNISNNNKKSTYFYRRRQRPMYNKRSRNRPFPETSKRKSYEVIENKNTKEEEMISSCMESVPILGALLRSDDSKIYSSNNNSTTYSNKIFNSSNNNNISNVNCSNNNNSNTSDSKHQYGNVLKVLCNRNNQQQNYFPQHQQKSLNISNNKINNNNASNTNSNNNNNTGINNAHNKFDVWPKWVALDKCHVKSLVDSLVVSMMSADNQQQPQSPQQSQQQQHSPQQQTPTSTLPHQQNVNNLNANSVSCDATNINQNYIKTDEISVKLSKDIDSKTSNNVNNEKSGSDNNENLAADDLTLSNQDSYNSCNKNLPAIMKEENATTFSAMNKLLLTPPTPITSPAAISSLHACSTTAIQQQPSSLSPTMANTNAEIAAKTNECFTSIFTPTTTSRSISCNHITTVTTPPTSSENISPSVPISTRDEELMEVCHDDDSPNNNNNNNNNNIGYDNDGEEEEDDEPISNADEEEDMDFADPQTAAMTSGSKKTKCRSSSKGMACVQKWKSNMLMRVEAEVGKPEVKNDSL
ncbi:hypothetical protein HELRODRAFT_166693 [Helobdella robusta]|uniref:Uncharacterized protein n=1 Tax=Helobdella robusta TaxID=6412 RepID=T1EYD5_HELRO|nr:hypothetical protein HELRODRAFT_166693 [Helobdella robusta]ESO11678.1 hypothetical protein HELRODRAFT_166693 [Helobdella robusta]